MIAYVLYNKATPNERPAADLAEKLEAEQVEVDLLDADSPRGIGLTETYDILDRPAVMLARTDGSPVQIWQGIDNMPAASEVSYLAHQ